MQIKHNSKRPIARQAAVSAYISKQAMRIRISAFEVFTEMRRKTVADDLTLLNKKGRSKADFASTWRSRGDSNTRPTA